MYDSVSIVKKLVLCVSRKAKLGVIGGMGPEATNLFCKFIMCRTDATKDQEHISSIVLSDTKMPDRTLAIKSGKSEEVYEKLLEDAQLLMNCGCTVLAIPCNTSHCFVDRLQCEISVPIVNMVRETAAYLAKYGRKKPAILATDGVVQAGLYRSECAAFGMEAVYPDKEIQRLIMSIIYDEIKRGEKGSRSTFQKIDRAVKEVGCDCAVLACTELSVFSTYHRLSAYYVDAMAVLAEKTVLACGYPLRII